MAQYMYGPMEGATSLTAGEKGLVPKPAAGDQGKFLKGDGTWGNETVPVQDVQVNGVSVLQDGVANVPLADSSNAGVAKVNSNYGIQMTRANSSSPYEILAIQMAGSSELKSGSNYYKPVVPASVHQATFYGLAKAAGVDMASVSGATVGVYPEAQKSAISQMLDAPETVSGSTPSITAKAGISYVCGECSTLTITLPASGCFDVTFDSGTTPTVLTATGVTWPDWFDATSLEANRTYELNINNGRAAVMSWA